MLFIYQFVVTCFICCREVYLLILDSFEKNGSSISAKNNQNEEDEESEDKVGESILV